MLTRILSGAILVLILAAVCVFASVPFVVSGVTALIAAIGIYEILRVAGITKHRPVTVGAVFYTVLWVLSTDSLFKVHGEWVEILTFVMILSAFTYYLRGYRKLRPEQMMFTMMMTLIVSHFFSAIVSVCQNPADRPWYLILIYLLSWIPDTGAYLAGSAFGKHKLCPVISPKKTVEGAIGGIVCCIAVTFLYAWLIDTFFEGIQANYAAVLLYAVLGTAVSVLGDLTASLIKRHYQVKDYGNLIPGHGGIMDRFDSVWFVAPFVALMQGIWPLFLTA